MYTDDQYVAEVRPASRALAKRWSEALAVGGKAFVEKVKQDRFRRRDADSRLTCWRILRHAGPCRGMWP